MDTQTEQQDKIKNLVIVLFYFFQIKGTIFHEIIDGAKAKKKIQFCEANG